jgi:hypothetical protein
MGSTGVASAWGDAGLGGVPPEAAGAVDNDAVPAAVVVIVADDIASPSPPPPADDCEAAMVDRKINKGRSEYKERK